jgi:ribA/ribD-fused uncharacterized protein
MINEFSAKYAFLSNFYPSEIFFVGMWFSTVEHAFLASKSPHQYEREKIRDAKTPGQAKRLGRSVRDFDVKQWDNQKIQVMRTCLWLKFKQPCFTEKLLETGTEELVEGNTWNDTFWGVCRGKGENNLGKLLMEIRTKIQQEATRM